MNKLLWLGNIFFSVAVMSLPVSLVWTIFYGLIPFVLVLSPEGYFVFNAIALITGTWAFIGAIGLLVLEGKWFEMGN